MPLKLNVGVCKKLGLPGYSSVGADCHIELELEPGLLEQPEAFKSRVRAAFVAARTAVDEELARHRVEGQPGGSQTSLPSDTREHGTPPAPPANGHAHRKERHEWVGRRPAGPAVAPPPAVPRTGGDLYRWAKHRERSAPGLIRGVQSWGRARGFPGRMIDWSADQVAAAHAEATRKLEEGE